MRLDSKCCKVKTHKRAKIESSSMDNEVEDKEEEDFISKVKQFVQALVSVDKSDAFVPVLLSLSND